MRTIHFVFVLVIAAAVTAGEMPRGFEIEGGKERQQKAADDLQRLVKSRFPSPDDVGPGWYRPWQGPPRVRARGLVPSEAAFWKKVRPPLPIAQFFGMEPAEAEQAIRKALKEGMAKLRAQPVPRDMPKELAPYVTTEAGILKVALLHLRTYHLKAVETQLIGMARLNKVSREFTQRFADIKERHQRELASAGGRRADVRKRQNEEEQRFMVMQTPFFIRGLCPDAVDGSYDEVLKIYVRDVLAVRRNAEMWYVYLTDENVAKARRNEAFQFALTVVALRLFAREEVEGRIEDVTAETAPGVKKELDDLLSHIRQQVMRTANPAVRAQMPKSITFDLATRELGDNGWILAINMPDLGLPGNLASYHARVRNGNAVVNITMSGTYPKAWMTKQLDYFLTAMDERTEVYREE